MIESSCFFKVTDIKKALVENNDVRDIIEDIVLSNIKFFVLRKDLDFILENIEMMEVAILKKGKKEENDTGVKILTVRITDFAECFHLNNIKNITYTKSKWLQ